MPGHDRARLERLRRYLLRPPLAQERLRRLPDRRVLVELKRAWADGTSHLLFEPLEFLERIYQKLGVETRTAAVAMAIQATGSESR